MEWTTVPRVKAYLGLAASDSGDDVALDGAVAAVNAWLDEYAPTVGGLLSPPTDPPSDPVPNSGAAYGATTLAARLFTTRNSPLGIASFSDLGGTTYVSRYLDVQTQQLLRLGRSTPGRVG